MAQDLPESKLMWLAACIWQLVFDSSYLAACIWQLVQYLAACSCQFVFGIFSWLLVVESLYLAACTLYSSCQFVFDSLKMAACGWQLVVWQLVVWQLVQ